MRFHGFAAHVAKAVRPAAVNDHFCGETDLSATTSPTSASLRSAVPAT